MKKNDPELFPNQIVRKSEGPKYFGFKRTQIDKKIKDGEIPRPIKLGARACGWTGKQIIDWQNQLIEN